jgi:hypothetical protein
MAATVIIRMITVITMEFLGGWGRHRRIRGDPRTDNRRLVLKLVRGPRTDNTRQALLMGLRTDNRRLPLRLVMEPRTDNMI